MPDPKKIGEGHREKPSFQVFLLCKTGEYQAILTFAGKPSSGR
jgi:hypothetical protein